MPTGRGPPSFCKLVVEPRDASPSGVKRTLRLDAPACSGTVVVCCIQLQNAMASYMNTCVRLANANDTAKRRAWGRAVGAFVGSRRAFASTLLLRRSRSARSFDVGVYGILPIHYMQTRQAIASSSMKRSTAGVVSIRLLVDGDCPLGSNLQHSRSTLKDLAALSTW